MRYCLKLWLVDWACYIVTISKLTDPDTKFVCAYHTCSALLLWDFLMSLLALDDISEACRSLLLQSCGMLEYFYALFHSYNHLEYGNVKNKRMKNINHFNVHPPLTKITKCLCCFQITYWRQLVGKYFFFLQTYI